MLSLGSILNITTNSPATAVQTENFSLGLIISKNAVITTSDRVKVYNSVNEIIAAGFDADSAEVKAATLYFGQNPRPPQIAIGVQAASEETALEALTACREASTSWYAFVFLGAETADIEAMAAYVKSAVPRTLMFYTSEDADLLAGTEGNVGLTLKAAKYDRVLGIYSTETDNAAAAVMGYVCGIATEASFDLMFKTLSGVTSEDLTSTQVTNLKTANVNYYTTYQNAYTFFANGVAASGRHIDQVVGIDVLEATMQNNIMSVLMSNTKIPLTDPGMSLIATAITQACDEALADGFIAPGTWEGGPVIDLKTGDSLPNGYSVQIAPVSTLSAADRANRVAPKAYACIILSGSGESFTITVNVQ